MARRLSKKKITGWLLLFAVIFFMCCGGPKWASTTVKRVFSKSETTKKDIKQPKPEDLVIDQTLAARLDSFVRKTSFKGSLGVYVFDETAHKTVYAYRPDSLMRPASNMKMVTCLAATRKYGPAYKITNEAYVDGTMKRDTLVGNIALKFTFDPWFTTDSLNKLVSAFQQRGIHAVKGKIILDLAMTQQMQHEEHWTPGDLRLSHLGMLFRGENRVKAEVKYALHGAGVNFNDKQIVVEAVPKSAKMVKKTSTQIHNSIYKALQNSNNEYAESLSFFLGSPYAKDGNFRQGATLALRDFIQKELKLNPDAVSTIHDGSGLCVQDRLSPRLLVVMLDYAYNRKFIYDELMRCLPISGTSGTLHQRMLKPDVMGKIRAKTGTLTREGGITSLSGYVKGKNGHQLIFGIIQNEYPVEDARLWQDKFCSQLVK